MRRLSTPVMLAACVSLIALQLSGLHMHVDAHGYVGTPESTHLHGQAGGHHHGDTTHLDLADTSHEAAHGGEQGHSGDTDVSIVKLGTAVSKLTESPANSLIAAGRLSATRRIPPERRTTPPGC